MKVTTQLLSSSLSGCGRKFVGFALKVQVSGDLPCSLVLLSTNEILTGNWHGFDPQGGFPMLDTT